MLTHSRVPSYADIIGVFYAGCPKITVLLLQHSAQKRAANLVDYQVAITESLACNNRQWYDMRICVRRVQRSINQKFSTAKRVGFPLMLTTLPVTHWLTLGASRSHRMWSCVSLWWKSVWTLEATFTENREQWGKKSCLDFLHHLRTERNAFWQTVNISRHGQRVFIHLFLYRYEIFFTWENNTRVFSCKLKKIAVF